MSEGILYIFNKPDLNRPIEEKFVAEINGKRTSFVNEDDAKIFLFDNGVKSFRFLTKEVHEYKDFSKVPVYEFLKLKNRVGYVTYGYEPYVDNDGKVKRRKAYIWRFIGFGRYCFAKTMEELQEMVLDLINYYQEDPRERGFNIQPAYTRYNR
jgi:hypothetical protein